MGKLHGLVAEGQGGSAGLRMAVLRVASDGISFLRADGEGQVVLPFSTLKMSTVGGGRPQWILQGGSHFPIVYIREEHDKEVLLNHAPGEIRRKLESLQPDTHRGFRRFFRRLIAFSVILTVVGALVSWQFPGVTRFLIRRLPLPLERALGTAARREYIEQLDYSLAYVDDPILENGIARIAGAVLADGSSDLRDIKVSLLGSEDIDAIAVPGGEIVLYTGLIAQADTPEEIAGVIAHQVEHLVLGHPLQNVAAHAEPATGFTALAMVLGVRTRWTRLLAGEMVASQFSDAQEKEADGECLRLLSRTGISPWGFFAFLRKSQEQQGIEQISLGFSLNHPNPLRRAVDLQRQADLLTWSKVPAFGRLNWVEIRQRAANVSRRMAGLLSSHEPFHGMS